MNSSVKPLFGFIIVEAAFYPIATVIWPGGAILLTYGLILAIAALGFNLLFAYTGLLSFGHAAFFGLGAYSGAFLYAYLRVRSLEAFISAGLVSALILSLIVGPLVVRYTRIYFAILMLALAQVLWSLYLKFYWVTGGTDGIKIPRLYMMGMDTSGLSYDAYLALFHYYALAIFVVLSLLMYRIVRSPLGYAVRAVRDNEQRAFFIGIPVHRARLYAFVISAAYSGIAGALYGPLNRLVTPETAYWTFSGKIVFMTILGGYNYFAGPAIGALVYTFIESLSQTITIYWQFIIGGLILAVMILQRGGVMELIEKVSHKLRGKRVEAFRG